MCIATRFLLTCLLRGMTIHTSIPFGNHYVSTHMPLARHDVQGVGEYHGTPVSTHMPLARHDKLPKKPYAEF